MSITQSQWCGPEQLCLCSCASTRESADKRTCAHVAPKMMPLARMDDRSLSDRSLTAVVAYLQGLWSQMLPAIQTCIHVTSLALGSLGTGLWCGSRQLTASRLAHRDNSMVVHRDSILVHLVRNCPARLRIKLNRDDLILQSCEPCSSEIVRNLIISQASSYCLMNACTIVRIGFLDVVLCRDRVPNWYTNHGPRVFKSEESRAVRSEPQTCAHEINVFCNSRDPAQH